VATRVLVEVLVASVGCALLAGALAANQGWLDRHFLPSFFLPRPWYVRLETFVRLALAAAGMWLAVVVRPRAGRGAERMPSRVVYVVLAAVMALAASELVLRHMHLRPAEWLVPEEEPRRRPDSQLGWTLVPGRTGHNAIGGRTVEYAFDDAGDRVRRVDEPVDPARPTIVFVGESVMFGEGLAWDESIPAQVAAMTGTQSANLAVHGFSNDQAYMQLARELPRFQRPVAVVSLFMTALFGRNLDSDRPHLGPGLVWQPAEQRGRVASLAALLVPYRSDETVDRGVSMAREVLRATQNLAQARGAVALVLVPQFGAEAPPEQMLRRRVFDHSGVAYELVEIDASWRLPWDRHPNARAARVIAAAVAGRLQRH
jgi:hypothetical protein